MRSLAQSAFVDEDDDSARFFVLLNLEPAGGQGHWRNPARTRCRWRPQDGLIFAVGAGVEVEGREACGLRSWCGKDLICYA
jgi:hypothetical protein